MVAMYRFIACPLYCVVYMVLSSDFATKKSGGERARYLVELHH